MRDEAEKRIGHLYPKVKVTAEIVQERPDLKQYQGRELTVIAWLWARTVKSPNPAFADVDVPLASTFVLSTKKGREVYVEPVIENGTYRFTVQAGTPPETAQKGTKPARGANFRCLMSDVPMNPDYIKSEGMAKRMGARLMAIVAEGDRGRVYLAPITQHEMVISDAKPEWEPQQDLPNDPRAIWCPLYGFITFADLFTDRQLVALTTFSDLVAEARGRIQADAVTAGVLEDDMPLRDGGTGAMGYAEAVGTYLALAIGRMSNSCSSFSRWQNSGDKVAGVFARQAIPMLWDYADTNVFSTSTQNWMAQVSWVVEAMETLPSDDRQGKASQADAASSLHGPNGSQLAESGLTISTDPPYYDNVGYADLSDFFYVWLRPSLRGTYPELFATVAVPKAEELVASPYRHGSREKAETFFLEGMSRVAESLTYQSHSAFPVTIYYAFKQAEARGDKGIASTGWETFLDALIRSGFAISGTWPIRTERGARSNAMDTNALASSIVLVCRPRLADVPVATRRDFIDSLKSELTDALNQMQAGNIAPVDLAQAAIGPGMAIFTRYSRILDASGEAVSVREALSLINQTLDEVLAEQEGDFDSDTRWALAWFEQSGFAEGEYGVAETLSKAKNTSVAGMVDAGILRSGAGKVQLLPPDQLPVDWDPGKDTRRSAWEMTHHLVRVHGQQGETAASELLAKLGSDGETARDLAYRLYRICDQRNRSQEALAYNALVRSWGEISGLASRMAPERQASLFERE